MIESLGSTNLASRGGTGKNLQIRRDFAQAIEKGLSDEIELARKSGSNKLDEILKPYLVDGKFDIDSLPQKAKLELERLENAAEDFEAYFIKSLMAKMRTASLSAEDSPMTGLAKDMMDTAVAEAASQGHSSIGIAKEVFVTMADRVIKTSVRNLSPEDK